MEINDEKISLFISKISYYGSLVSIPKELIIFCNTHFGIEQTDLITEMIYAIQTLLKPKYFNETNEEKLEMILPSSLPDDLKKSLIKNLLKKNECHPNKDHRELITTVKGVNCKRISQTEFRIDLQTRSANNNNCDSIYENDETVSFLVNQQQLTNIFNEMDQIRQQLFHSVT